MKHLRRRFDLLLGLGMVLFLTGTCVGDLFAADCPLSGLDNVILTDHTGWYSEASVRSIQEKAAQAAVETLREGPTPAELAAAEAGVRQAQAGLEAVQARRERATLTSPIDGRVLERTVEVGETALPGAVLLRLTDPATTTLTVYVPEDDVSAVDLRQDVEVEAAAYPDDVFDGEVTAIADEAEFTPKNVQTEDQRSNLVFAVTIAVDNPRDRLKPGMSADARFERD